MTEILVPNKVLLSPGFRIVENPNNTHRVVVNVEKGEQKTILLIEPAIMLRFRIPIVGELNKYIQYDKEIIREVIDQVDIELELVERFFTLRNTKEVAMSILKPLYEKYEAVIVGQKLGEIELSYPEFIKFLEFIKYLSYEPILNDDKNHLF